LYLTNYSIAISNSYSSCIVSSAAFNCSRVKPDRADSQHYPIYTVIEKLSLQILKYIIYQVSENTLSTVEVSAVDIYVFHTPTSCFLFHMPTSCFRFSLGLFMFELFQSFRKIAFHKGCQRRY